MEHAADTSMLSSWTLELILLKARYHATEKVQLRHSNQEKPYRRNLYGQYTLAGERLS